MPLYMTVPCLFTCLMTINYVDELRMKSRVVTETDESGEEKQKQTRYTEHRTNLHIIHSYIIYRVSVSSLESSTLISVPSSFAVSYNTRDNRGRDEGLWNVNDSRQGKAQQSLRS